MANYPDSDYEIAQLAEEVRTQLELDRRYARETREAYEAQKHYRLYEIVTRVVINVYGFLREDIVGRILQLLRGRI